MLRIIHTTFSRLIHSTHCMHIMYAHCTAGSAEEAKDVLEAYEECEGDMDGILDNVMCSRPEDEDRFVGIIQEGITKGKVTAHVAFTGASC